MQRGLRFSVLAVALIALSTFQIKPAAAGFVGDSVSANYLWPDVNTVLYAGGNATVGPGVEFSSIGGSSISADFSDSQILVTYNGGWLLSGFNNGFDGFRFDDNTSSSIVGVSLGGTDMAGLSASDLSFGSNFILVNTAGLGPSFDAGTFFTLDVAFAAAAPEPSTWAMMILGFVGIGAMAYRRSKQTTLRAA
jgi:hypothetical protein